MPNLREQSGGPVLVAIAMCSEAHVLVEAATSTEPPGLVEIVMGNDSFVTLLPYIRPLYVFCIYIVISAYLDQLCSCQRRYSLTYSLCRQEDWCFHMQPIGHNLNHSDRE